MRFSIRYHFDFLKHIHAIASNIPNGGFWQENPGRAGFADA